MSTQTLDFTDIEMKFFWFLSSLLMVVVTFYLYSVLSLTFAVVDRDNINRTIRNVAVTSGLVESEYLALSNRITLSYAETLGFKELNVKFANTSDISTKATDTSSARLSLAVTR